MDALTRSIWKNMWGRLDGVEPTPGGGSDPHFANVVYLHNFDTPSTTDVTGKTATLVGNAAISGGSLVLDGNGDRLALTSASSGFAFAGDFTIEVVFNKTGNGSQGFDTLFDCSNGGDGVNGWFIEFSTSRTCRLLAGSLLLTGAGNPNTGTDQYWVVKRSGSTCTLERNLTVIDTETNSGAISGSANAPTIGSARGAYLGQYAFNGSVLAMRITNGVARDTSVIPTLPFPES
jgi:hypothetical protein